MTREGGLEMRTSLRRTAVAAIALLGLLLAGSGCGSDETSPRTDAATTVDVTLSDEGTAVSGPVRPGGTVRIRNNGEQMHMFLLARLHDGRSLADATAALRSGDDSAMDNVADEVGAPSSHLPPGRTVEVTTEGLTTGHYIVADFYPSEGGDGSPNVFARGLAELVVAGRPIRDQPGDAHYAVAGGQPISGPVRLSPGRHQLTFTGLSGRDGKEISIWRVNDGETVPAIQAKLFEIFDASDGNGLTADGAGHRVAEHVLCWVLPPDNGGPVTLGVNLDAGTYELVAADIDADDAATNITEHLTVAVR